MCGIVSVVLCGDVQKGYETRRKTADVLFSSILAQTEERGKDATGLATCFKNGDYCGLKMGVKSTEFIERRGDETTYFNGYMKKLYENPSQVVTHIGHCRKSSVGNNTENANNHPVRCGDVVGVHNGTLSNHEAVFEELGCKRDGDVDTEAIFRIMEHLTENGKKPFSIELLQDVARRLNGTFTTLSFLGNAPHQLAILRDTRPLDICYIKPLQLFVAASDKKFIERAIWYYNLGVRLNCTFEGAVLLEKGDIEHKTFFNTHVGLVDASVDGKEIDDVLKIGRFEGAKIWQTKRSVTQANTGMHNTATGTGTGANSTDGGAGRGYSKPHTAPPPPTKETNKSSEEDQTKDTADDFIWVAGIGDYVKAVSATSLRKGTCIVDATKISEVGKKHSQTTQTNSDDTPENNKDVYVCLIGDSVFESVDSASQLEVGIGDSCITVEVPEDEEDWKDNAGLVDQRRQALLEHLTCAYADDADDPADNLPVFSSEEDVANYLGLLEDDMEKMNGIPSFIFASYISRVIYRKAFSQGYQEAQKDASKKITGATSSIAVAKQLALLLAASTDPDNIPANVAAFARTAGKDYVGAFGNLFSDQDLKRCGSLRKIKDIMQS